MKKYLLLLFLSTAWLLMQAYTALATVIPFTGDAAADFGPYPTVEVTDPLWDVGFPPDAPDGTISGWEIEKAVFYLSLESNVLQVGLEAVGIAGDVDGNGIDGVTPQWLDDLGGVDYPDLMNSESMGIAFDFDLDGFYDLIAGVSASDGVHRTCQFSGFPALPFLAYGAELPLYNGGRFYTPMAATPDYEMTIANIADWLIWEGGETCFNFLAFGGSFEDDGIGEEYVFGTICLEDHILTEMAVPENISIAAYPNPFNPGTTVQFALPEAGPVTLKVYNLTGNLITTLVDSDLPAGDHQITFDGTDLPSGLYIAQVTTTNATSATRMILLK